MVFRAYLAAPLIACLGLSACQLEDDTTLVIVIDSNYPVPQELGRLRVIVEDEQQGRRLLRKDIELSGPDDLPTSLEVGGSGGQAVRVEVQARSGSGGEPRSARLAVTQLVKGRRLILPMFLARHCSWTPPCATDETCTEDAACASALIAPEALAEAHSDAVLELPFDPAACGRPCQQPTCGNGDADDPGEVCDDGNRVSGDGCRADCAGFELCGDGIVDKEVDDPEECDDGNDKTERCEYGERECVVCDASCKLRDGEASFCGDGVVADGEVCDDGNNDDGDGCRADCGSELRCGDGVVDDGAPLLEVCDDGNQRDCDGCNADCRSFSECGDGVLCPGEVCDPAIEEDCRADCGGPRECGDGFLDADLDEQCDDGDRVVASCAYGAMSCTVCSDACRQVPGAASYCGDGVLTAGEETCDWGLDDDCRADCTRCGDGVLDAQEDCDNAGEFDADCSSLCNRPIFFDDMEGVDPGWTEQRLSGTVDVPSFRWVSGQRAASGNTSRHSGRQPGSDNSGDTRLLSPPIDVSGLDRVLVSFSHYYDFDRCPAGTGEDLDGAFVEVALDGVFTPVVPAESLDVLGSCGPLSGQPVYSGSSADAAFERVQLELEVTGATTLHLGFHVRWDCQGALGCATSPEPIGWYIDDVGVAPVPP